MATRNRTAAKMHLLTVREVQTALDGDRSDGGSLMLRVRGDSAKWTAGDRRDGTYDNQ